jgi:signal transduction histidine kinase
VRVAARELTGADGATFILRDDDRCFYADEDAVSPLWKGQRFPMDACVSGWAMLHRQAVVIEDIYADDRVPHDAYRPTFVKSLAMVPIRTVDPIGAIGTYWATRRPPSEAEVRLLQALADSTAVALENVQVYADLERRVAARTAELTAANEELGRAMRSLREFVAVAAHDLRGPLANIRMAADLWGDGRDRRHQGTAIGIIRAQANHLLRLTEDLMTLSVIDAGGLEARRAAVELKPIVDLAAAEIGQDARVIVGVEDGVRVHADRAHVQRIVANLLRNAVKYGDEPIEVAASPHDESVEIAVVDHGPGVPDDVVPRLFERFSRSETAHAKEGAGLGLSIVRELARINGGDVRYDPLTPHGARFRVQLVKA